MNKKAAVDFHSDWVEIVFFFVLVLGIILGILSPSAFVTYLVALLCGVAAGRVFYDQRGKGRAKYILLIIGALIGLVIGAFHGDKRTTFLLFVFGAVLSYYVFKKKILKDTLY